MKLSNKAVRHANGTRIYEYRFQFRRQSFVGTTDETDKRKAWAVANEALRLAESGLTPAQVRFQLANAPIGASPLAMPISMATGSAITLNLAMSSYFTKRERDLSNPQEDWTWHSEQKALIEMRNVIGKDLPIVDLDETHVRKAVAARRYKVTEKGTLPTASYVNRYTWKLLRRVHNHARDILNLSVTAINWKDPEIRLKEEATEERYIGPAQMLAMVEAKDKRGRPMFTGDYADLFDFGLMTGFRKMNLSIRWKQVDLGKKTITVRQKAGRLHVIHIDADLMKLLVSRLGLHPTHVFTYIAKRTRKNPKNGASEVRGERRPMTASGFTSWLKSVAKAAGVDVTPHDLRRTCATRILMATGDIAAASKRLGHADIAITAKLYARVLARYENSVMERANALAKQEMEEYRDRIKQHSLPNVGGNLEEIENEWSKELNYNMKSA